LDGPGTLLREFEQTANDVIVLARRGLFDLVTFAKLLGHIRRIRPTTVHTTLYIANLFGGWAARLAGVPNVVVSQRGLGIDPRHSRLKRGVHALFNGFIGAFSDVRTVNSRAISEKMSTYGWENCHIIHNGVLDCDYPSEGRLAELRLELGIPDGSTVLTTVSRIDPKKDLVTMLRSFRRVLDSEPGTYLLIVGGGFADYAQRLKDETEQLGVDDHVRFLGFRDDVSDILALCDISLLSSVTEGLPNAILEAMLFAKPVVATKVGGVPELIDHGVEGYLVKSGDPEGFANRVVDLIRDPARREAMGTFGRARALSDFSVRTTVAKTTATYRAESLAGNQKPKNQGDTSRVQI
jgi:glycosyltransferase involved in cell wall biosynthesis